MFFKFFFVDSEEQQHCVANAFNILTNEGFLRDQQGVQTLEVVQKFYEITGQKLERATLKISNLLDFCNRIGDDVEVQPKPVLTLKKTTENGETCFHAVVLKSYFRSEEYLDLVTIDSSDLQSEAGETEVECSILDDGDKPFLAIGEFPYDLGLSSEKCYCLHFN